MELSTDAIHSVNDYGHVRGLAAKITSVHVLGALCIIGYAGPNDEPFVVTDYLRSARTLTDQILDVLKRALHSGRASSMVEQASLVPAPQSVGPTMVDLINQQFQMQSSFHALEGWVLGTMYLVHGLQNDNPAIITGNYHGLDRIPQSVALAVEIDAVQYLCSQERAGYSIEIDKHKFYLPRG